MKKHIKKLFYIIVMALVLTGVTPDIPLHYTKQISTVEAASKVKLNKKKATLTKGKTLQLKVIGTKKKAKWSSSNKKVATVSSKGKVTAKKAGKATITAKVSGKKYTCKVTVKKAPTSVLSASKKKINIYGNDTEKIIITFTKYGQLNTSSADKSIFSYSWGEWDGDNIPLYITGEKNGTTTFTIGSDYNSDKVNITVTVEGIEERITYGSVSGNVTYFYNNFKGNVPDTGADVFLIPLDGTGNDMPDLSSYVYWGGSLINSKGNDYKIYGTRVDGMGQYVLQNIPTGKYVIFMVSSKTTSGSAFSNKEIYEKNVATLLSNLLNSVNAEYMGKAVGFNKYTYQTIEVRENQNYIYSHDFGTTYI